MAKKKVKSIQDLKERRLKFKEKVPSWDDPKGVNYEGNVKKETESSLKRYKKDLGENKKMLKEAKAEAKTGKLDKQFGFSNEEILDSLEHAVHINKQSIRGTENAIMKYSKKVPVKSIKDLRERAKQRQKGGK